MKLKIVLRTITVNIVYFESPFILRPLTYITKYGVQNISYLQKVYGSKAWVSLSPLLYGIKDDLATALAECARQVVQFHLTSTAARVQKIEPVLPFFLYTFKFCNQMLWGWHYPHSSFWPSNPFHLIFFRKYESYNTGPLFHETFKNGTDSCTSQGGTGMVTLRELSCRELSGACLMWPDYQAIFLYVLRDEGPKMVIVEKMPDLIITATTWTIKTLEVHMSDTSYVLYLWTYLPNRQNKMSIKFILRFAFCVFLGQASWQQ